MIDCLFPFEPIDVPFVMIVMKHIFLLFVSVFLLSCEEEAPAIIDESTLAGYIAKNSERELSDLIACAGGREGGLSGSSGSPTSIFFYPLIGATEFRYFEAEQVADSVDFTKYRLKELTDDPVFNGYLWQFNNTPFEGERMAVVTFKTPGKLHVCTPIRQKTNVKPTEVNNDLLAIDLNGLSPRFDWQDGIIDESMIYFQVISDQNDNFISGTYTFERNFTFYELDNVVLNITDSTSLPVLQPNTSYKFTMMGVSEDNWVNLFIEKEFQTM